MIVSESELGEKMNTYLTSYFPLFSITFFSIAIAIRIEIVVIESLKKLGMYNGLLEFFSNTGIRLSLLVFFSVLFFMVLSALKLIAETLNEISLLFFSKEHQGESLTRVRKGSIIYLIGSILSLFTVSSFILIAIVFIVTTLVYFVYYVNGVSEFLSMSGIIFFIFFQVFTWTVLLLSFTYLCLKLYNGLLASLPI